jgi:hypothetical protein
MPPRAVERRSGGINIERFVQYSARFGHRISSCTGVGNMPLPVTDN